MSPGSSRSKELQNNVNISCMKVISSFSLIFFSHPIKGSHGFVAQDTLPSLLSNG